MVSIVNKTKGKLPRLPFEQMKDFVLGKKYNLSLVFISKKTSQKLNLMYRGKNSPTDILSFPLEKKGGEIVINPDSAKAKAVAHDRTYQNYIGFLFIHGLCHLKGFDHGNAMDKAEVKIRKVFKI